MFNFRGQSIGRYQVLDQLGVGGMAVVYKAFDTHLECNVAIKFLRTDQLAPTIIEKALKRFEREAKTIAQLNHPNIIKVTDYGEYEDIPYLVMTYVPGGTLKQLLGLPIPYQQAARLLLPIADALQYAHEHNVIHRDVKPANILISESGIPMLADFGVAKILDVQEGHTLTATGVGIGTPEYMAPEQGLGKTVDARSDLYSLAVVLYELVTGHKPYTADTPMAVILKQSTEPLPKPSSFVSNLPEQVDQVLFKALNKSPENRYQTMREFKNGLDVLANNNHPYKENPLQRSLVVDTDSFPTVDKLILSPQQEDQKYLSNFENISKRSQKLYKSGTNNIFRWVGICLFSIFGVLLLAQSSLTINLPFFLSYLGISTKTVTPVPKVTTFDLDSTDDKPTATLTKTANITSTPTFEKTPLTNETQKVIPTNPQVNISSKMVSEKDGMILVYVPAGEFMMGSPQGIGHSDEFPQHTVFLEDYWIDQTEITNEMYRKCVSENTCGAPATKNSFTQLDYFTNTAFNMYPVLSVNWSQAKSYCEWAGRRLPTEAEWEYAAKGTEGKTFPWGNNFQCKNGNFDTEKKFDLYTVSGDTLDCDPFDDTSPVGSFIEGASPYGVLDMAGNVWEWVQDWYGNYSSATQYNPSGSATGEERVLRGGSWNSNSIDVRTTNRISYNPLYVTTDFGFRCAMDAH